MIGIVRTILLGDQTQAAKRVPFAKSKLAMMMSRVRSGMSRFLVERFVIEGDTIDIRADGMGGRIIIQSTSVAAFWFYGTVSAGRDWHLFTDTLEELPARAVEIDPGLDDNEIIYTGEDASASGFLGYRRRDDEDTGLTYRDLTFHSLDGALLWLEEEDYLIYTPLPGNSTGDVGNGACLAGSYAIRANGTASASQVIYENHPFNLNILGYQLEPSTLRYERVNVSNGGDKTTEPTKTATIFGDTEAVFLPNRLAGAGAQFDSFHALGIMYTEGTDEFEDRSNPTHWELHHVSTSLTTLDTVVLSETAFGADQAHDLTIDDQGRVYVLFQRDSEWRYEAYSRELLRMESLDFRFLPSEGRTAIIRGDFLYYRLTTPPSNRRIVKYDRAGNEIETFSVSSTRTGENMALYRG